MVNEFTLFVGSLIKSICEKFTIHGRFIWLSTDSGLHYCWSICLIQLMGDSWWFNWGQAWMLHEKMAHFWLVVETLVFLLHRGSERFETLWVTLVWWWGTPSCTADIQAWYHFALKHSAMVSAWSSIFQEVPTYYLAKFSWKLLENEETGTERGHASKILLCRSATDGSLPLLRDPHHHL